MAKLYAVLFSLLLLLGACGTPEETDENDIMMENADNELTEEEQTGYIGEISEIDEDENRILLEGQETWSGDDVSIWLTVGDGEIVDEAGEQYSLSDLRIGLEAEAWVEGEVEDSDPQQGDLEQLIITSE
ncbi:hypothetical protein [Evansella clarkii]|uniref:hypothetical protein n=1 Tax=Evansella clarkii TaxID=79879 RepID=UPI000B445D57|nr:hypothetical protein [Evansella clarkii]